MRQGVMYFALPGRANDDNLVALSSLRIFGHARSWRNASNAGAATQ